jgi:hypothetical protein
MSAAFAFYNTAQALAFLSFVGLIICLWRLKNSDHPQHLFAFALMLAGTLLREFVALAWDIGTWTNLAIGLSAIARTLKIGGAILFVRAVTQPRCGEWGWIAVGVGSVLFAAAVQR